MNARETGGGRGVKSTSGTLTSCFPSAEDTRRSPSPPPRGGNRMSTRFSYSALPRASSRARPAMHPLPIRPSKHASYGPGGTPSPCRVRIVQSGRSGRWEMAARASRRQHAGRLKKKLFLRGDKALFYVRGGGKGRGGRRRRGTGSSHSSGVYGFVEADTGGGRNSCMANPFW